MGDGLDAILSECLLDFDDFDLPFEPANPAFSVFDPVPNIFEPPSEPRLNSSASSSSSSRFGELKTDSDLEVAKAQLYS